MGCSQSKSKKAGEATVSAKKTSNAPSSSPSAVKPPPSAVKPLPKSGNPPGPALYHHLLSGLNTDSQETFIRALTTSFWEEARKICSANPTLASYVDPTTNGTPLHVACSLGSAQVNTQPVSETALLSIRAIIEAYPEAVGHCDKHSHIPLDGIFSGLCGGGNNTGKNQDRAICVPSFYFRTETSKLLLEHSTAPPNLRGGILYKIVESFPDDLEAPLGPTVEFVQLLVEKAGVSAGTLEDSGTEDDDVLALLYRRFVRQFDQSEKFFEGDNSRPEVVQHRQNYKNAAINTFNVIELLLRQPNLGTPGAENDLLVHNAVRAGSCPPDLLRYIVETNLEAVAETDSKGNLPLHYAAGGKDSKAPESYSKYVIDELLYAYPEGAGVANADGVLPIVLAIESGKKWIGGGIRSLHDAYPQGIEEANLRDDHPLMNAMSFLSQEDASVDESVTSNLANGQNEEGTIASGVDGGGGRRRKRRQRRKINKDESHDAIMFVQKTGAPVRDIITIMWANEEDGGVGMLGCSALELAATGAGSSEEKVSSVALLGVTTVVNAMKNHPNEPAVQEKACSALTAMAHADGVREVSFAASGAISTVVSAMQAHINDATVQKEACKALRSIAAKGGAERATVVASVSGFTALVNSMGAHPKNKDVQREACAALEVLTGYRNAYLPKLQEQTASLLQAAANNFPQDCSELSKNILERLNEADDGVTF